MPDPTKSKQNASAETAGPASGSGELGNQAGAKNERDFLRIAAYATALAFGVMCGTIQSYHRDASGFYFKMSLATAVAFVIGAVVGFLYWKLVAFTARRGTPVLFRATSFLLLLAVVAALLSPLRFLSAQTLSDVMYGLAIDAAAFVLLGFIFWRIRNFLNRDAAQGDITPAAPVTSQGNPPVAESHDKPANRK